MSLNFDEQMNEIVRESFKTTRKYIWRGVFCFLFYFAAIYTLKDGILPIIAQTLPSSNDIATEEEFTDPNMTDINGIPIIPDPTDVPVNEIKPKNVVPTR